MFEIGSRFTFLSLPGFARNSGLHRPLGQLSRNLPIVCRTLLSQLDEVRSGQTHVVQPDGSFRFLVRSVVALVVAVAKVAGGVGLRLDYVRDVSSSVGAVVAPLKPQPGERPGRPDRIGHSSDMC